MRQNNLPGQWPTDSISKAANLGMLDDITFISCEGATYEEFFILCNAGLKQYLVEYHVATKSCGKVLKMKSDFMENGDRQNKYPIL
jgi:hypothetical protein